jgi:hypothetical protein
MKAAATDHYMIVDEDTKRNLGILSVIPFISWFMLGTYYSILAGQWAKSGAHHPLSHFSTVVYQHFNTVMIMITISVLLTAFALFYFVLHIARIKSMTTFTKMGWIVFLIALGAVGMPMFWYLQIRSERKFTPVWGDIK